MEQLEKIDLIRERMHVSYAEAKEALEKANGDVLEALVMLENEQHRPQEELWEKGKSLIKQLKEVLQKGNVTKIYIKKDGQRIFEFPANIGVAGIIAMLASAELAIIGGLGSVAAMLNKYTLEIVRSDGQTEERNLEM